MKKKLTTILLSSALALNVTTPAALAESELAKPQLDIEMTEVKDLQVTVNGEQVQFNVSPMIKDSRILVPLRDIFEAMGASVYWDEVNKAITAIKNEGFVNLKIDSKIAQIEGKDFPLDVPATIHNNRTLVPLRFVSEAFEGEVDWNEEDKTVTITVPPTIFIPVDSPVYLDNKELDFGSYVPVVWNGVTFIPMEAVFESFPRDIHWERQGDVIFVEVDGVQIKYFVGKNYATVNGKQIEWNEPVMEYDGILVTPTNSIIKVFGGTSHYVAETKEIYLYLDSIKFAHEFLPKETYTFAKPTNVENVTVNGNRRLMVSDNPEKLTEQTVPEENVTLWEDKVYTSETELDHRVFGWHLNKLEQDVTIGITIENLSYSNEIEIVGLNGASQQRLNGWVNYDIGLPIAEKMLSGTGLPVELDTPIVKEKETILLKSFDFGTNNTLGFQYDFTVRKVSGTGNLNYKIRTVLSKNGEDLTTITSDPVEIDQTAKHPRGVWSSSQLLTELPPYEIGSGEVGHQISNGATDNLLSAIKGIGDKENMLNNPGHYGASYLVKIPIINQTGDSKTIRVRLGARGGLYNGAVKINDNVYITPTLKPMTEVANVIDYVVEKEEDMIELEIMHAGGSSLPLTINLITVEEE